MFWNSSGRKKTRTLRCNEPKHGTNTHLRRFVPHVGNVLLLAVVLRPGTCQVRASDRALWGPQLDAKVGDGEENGGRGNGRTQRPTPAENRGEAQMVKATVWGGKGERWVGGAWECKRCPQTVNKSTDTQLSWWISLWTFHGGMSRFNPNHAGQSGYTPPRVMALKQL